MLLWSQCHGNSAMVVIKSWHRCKDSDMSCCHGNEVMIFNGCHGNDVVFFNGCYNNGVMVVMVTV